MRLGIPVYQDVNLLDVAGPLEMFYWAGQLGNDLQTVLISSDGKAVTSINGVTFEVGGASFNNTPALDILWVPGGKPEALEDMLRDPTSSPYLKYLRQIADDATWVCSVCEGALLLARAGLLNHHKATTHWSDLDCLKKLGADVDMTLPRPRFVVSERQTPTGKERRLTGGGISSGLDEALKLISLLFGDEKAEAVQRMTEYFPKPPVMGAIREIPKCDMDLGPI
jgi:transcriptional regulator GlxA family with amidase domain